MSTFDPREIEIELFKDQLLSANLKMFSNMKKLPKSKIVEKKYLESFLQMNKKL